MRQHPLPSELKFKQSTTNLKFLFLPIWILYTGAGVWMVSIGESVIVALICIIFVGILGMLYCLMGLKHPTTLTLNEEGFEQKVANKSLKYSWHDVSEFDAVTVSIRLAKYVTFTLYSDEDEKGIEILKSLYKGNSRALINPSGLQASYLANLMNSFRSRALGS